MRMCNRRRALAGLGMWVAAALLAACGGGGGGGQQAAVTIPLSNAIANYINQSRSSTVSISGSVTGGGQTLPVSGSATVTESTGPGTFEGQAALRKSMSISGSVSILGTSAPLSDSSQAFFDSNYRPLGSTSATSYCVTTAASALPATARVGDSGSWFSQTCYESSAKLAPTATSTSAYVIEPDTSTTAVLKLLVTSSATGGPTLTSQSTFRVGGDGSITRLQDRTEFQVDGASMSLTMTYQ